MQDGQSGKPLWNNSVRPAWCALIAGRQLKLLHAKTICTDPLFALLAAPLAEAACRLITWWISAHRTVPASLFTCTWQAQESCREMDRCTGLQARERRHVHLCTSKAAVDSRQPAADQLPPRLGTPARPARVQAIRNSDFVLEAVGSYSGRVQLRAGWRHRVRDCLDCFPRAAGLHSTLDSRTGVQSQAGVRECCSSLLSPGGGRDADAKTWMSTADTA